MKRERTRRGYTVVELMMAISVMVIGLGGIIAMQKVTVASNMNAKNLAIATHIGQAFLDELAAESNAWTQADNFAATVWLTNVGAQGTAAAWFTPVYNATRNLGPGFDALGNPVLAANMNTDAQFCVHLRLTWLSAQNSGKTGAGLIRTEVRVYWRREGTGFTTTNWSATSCISPEDYANWSGAPRFHNVYLASAVRQGG